MYELTDGKLSVNFHSEDFYRLAKSEREEATLRSLPLSEPQTSTKSSSTSSNKKSNSSLDEKIESLDEKNDDYIVAKVLNIATVYTEPNMFSQALPETLREGEKVKIKRDYLNNNFYMLNSKGFIKASDIRLLS